MQIKKLSDEVIYSKITNEAIFEVNGKKVRVVSWNVQDPEMGVYEGDTDINENDLKALSDEEYEAIGENLTELLETEVGEITKI